MAKPTQAQIDALAAAPTKAGLDALIAGNTGCTGIMTDSKRCNACSDCQRCTDCDTCVSCQDCGTCDNARRCTSSTFLSHCYDCSACNGKKNDLSVSLYKCVGCSNCDHCIGLCNAVGKSYNICGVDGIAPATFNAIFAVVEAAG
jgi:hypothetical protein